MFETDIYDSDRMRGILTEYAEECEGNPEAHSIPRILGFAYQWLGDKRFRKYAKIGEITGKPGEVKETIVELGEVNLETGEVEGMRWLVPLWFRQWLDKYAPGFDPTIEVEDEAALMPIERAAYRGVRVINGMIPPWNLMPLSWE